MDICKLLERKTTSSDNSVFLKNTEKICQEENINASTNNEGVGEDGLSNDIFYLLDKNPSDNEKFEYICHFIPDNSFNYLAKQWKGSQRKSGFMDWSWWWDLIMFTLKVVWYVLHSMCSFSRKFSLSG